MTLLTLEVLMFYIGARSRPPNPTTLRRNHNPGKPTRPPRTQRPSPSQRAAHKPSHGTSERRHLLYQGPRLSLTLTIRRWKTPWTVPKSPHGASRPTERNGAARSRGPLGSPSASSNKTGLSATPGSWIQAANRKPTTPARGTDPGLSPSCTRLRRTAQPTLIGAYDG